ncbi:tetratricopeptide repeat protein [Paractinoplanes maris]|uniref:tetratricopeptide repeat protein n=1 Tax=Paractinoplanes maris TaxID=1734446 RepID=UPI0020205D88|nr:tetratricopeptide repeat protein [Actinoplanes maris]
MSTLLAVLVGALTNLATGGWSLPLTIALVVLAGTWIVIEVRQRAHEQRTAAIEARDRVLATLEHKATTEKVSAFDLLMATRQVMPFQGRRNELDELEHWCDGDAPAAVLILAGPAGSGKTRLAMELARSRPAHWAGGWLTMGRGGEAVEKIVAGGDPAVVLVDDAGTRQDLPALVTALAGHEGPPSVRVLLITRDAAGLQAALEREVPDSARWLARARVVRIGPHGGEGDRERWYVQAVGRFARELDMLAPPTTQLTGRVGAPDETMLLLLARALLTVYAAGERSQPADRVRRLPVAEVIEQLFTHEAAWWESAAQSPAWAVSRLGTETRQRAILALVLRGADDEEAAVEVLRRVPDLSDAAEIDLRNTARWVAHLYPAARIEPDLLGDWFIVDRLSRHPALAERLLADLGPAEHRHAALVLTRATTVFPTGMPVLTKLWESGHSDGIAVAVEIAMVHHAKLVDEQLALFLSDRDLPEQTLVSLDDRLPEFALPRACGVVSRLLVAHCRAASCDGPVDHARLARALNSLAHRLSNLGDHRGAHSAISEAVELCRTLAADDPAHRPALAGALNGLGTCHAALGNHQQALAAASESVALWRTLTADEPSAVSGLADSLIGLGGPRRSLDDRLGAHAAATEAVTLLRVLAAEDSRHRPSLARGLNNLGVMWAAVGDHQQARSTISEAVETWRALVAEDARFQPNLARALDNSGIQAANFSDFPQAHAASTESVSLWRVLAADNPAYRPDLASALSSLGNRWAAVGDHRQAHKATQESVALWRTLAPDNPAHHPQFAGALLNLGARWSSLGDHRQALSAAAEAVTRWRALVADNPAYRSELAGALNNLGLHRAELRDHRQAHIDFSEAVQLWRTLAADNEARQADFAATLTNLAVNRCKLGDHDEEFAHRREAVSVLRTAADRDAELYEGRYQRALAKLRSAYVRHGREAEAVRLSRPRQADSS